MAGLILQGSYVDRKNRDKVMNDQSLPNILTIGGELDGLKTRIYTKTANKYDINQPISFFFLSSSKPFQFHVK